MIWKDGDPNSKITLQFEALLANLTVYITHTLYGSHVTASHHLTTWVAAACHLNNSVEKPGNLFESVCPDETTYGLQGAPGLKPKPAGCAEP